MQTEEKSCSFGLVTNCMKWVAIFQCANYSVVCGFNFIVFKYMKANFNIFFLFFMILPQAS